MLLLNCPLDLCCHCSVEMDRRAFTHKGLFQAVCGQFYRAGSDAKAVSVAVWCGDTEWP